MDNKVINQVLAELEDSLANLESARNQVNTVSRKSENLISAFSNVLKQLERVEKEKLFDDDEFKKKVEASYIKFNQVVELTNKDFTNKYGSIYEDFKNEISTILERLKNLEKDLMKLNKTIIKTEEKASLFDYKKAIQDFSLEVKSKIDKIESNHSLNNKNIQNEVNIGFKDTIKKISDVDASTSIRSLNVSVSDNTKKIDKLEKEVKDSFESLKIEFESNLNSSLSTFKKTLLLINLGSFGILLIILTGLVLKWLKYF